MNSRTIALLAFGVATTAARADALVVDLTHPDAFVNRAVVATRADASAVRGVLDITAYDAASKTFVLETATEGALRMPVDALPHLVFARSPRQASPMAQACPTTVRETAGAQRVLTIPAASLAIANGRLTIEGSPPIASVAGGVAVVEAVAIDYDRDVDAFRVEVQPVTYESVPAAGCASRSSTGAKGLQ